MKQIQLKLLNRVNSNWHYYIVHHPYALLLSLIFHPHVINVQFSFKLAWEISFEEIFHTNVVEHCRSFRSNKAWCWSKNCIQSSTVKCCNGYPLLFWVNCCSMFNTLINTIRHYLSNNLKYLLKSKYLRWLSSDFILFFWRNEFIFLNCCNII